MTSSIRGGHILINKVVLLIVLESIYFFVFLATGASEKLLISENRYLSGFQGHVGGIGGSGVQTENLKIFGERHSRQESGDEVDTLRPPQFEEVIFSCFTLWSIMWREASSLRTSSREIPISVISTII